MWRRANKLEETTKKIKKDMRELKLSFAKLNKRLEKLQQKLPRKKTTKSLNARFWTATEENQLVTELTQKMSIDDIIKVHNRSNNAIGSRIIKIVRDHIELGTTSDDISKKLNVDINFVNLVSTSNDNKMLLEKLIILQ
jgi:hypothetical protein